MADARRVLLLGATGFLGRHIRLALEAAGDSVLTVAGPSNPDAAWRAIDLAAGELGRVVGEAAPHVVVNAAGRTHGSAAELEAANVEVVRRLLDAVAVHPARLVHLGSAAEYGPGVANEPTSEDGPERPVADYGRTKLRATELVRSSGLDATVLRVFNPVGAGMAPDSMPGRAARLVAAALASGADEITMGSLDAQRDFIDARDVADAVLAATRVPGAPPIINIGTGRPVVARQLVEALAGVAGFSGVIREEGSASPRSGAVDYQCADVRLAHRTLGWQARRTLQDAVAALWAGVGS